MLLILLIGLTLVVCFCGVGAICSLLKSKTQLSKLKTDNSKLQYEIAVYKDLDSNLRLGIKKDNMLEMQKKYIDELQKLDIVSRNSKATVEMQNFKMVKSIETFNICCDLVAKNKILMNLISKSNENEGMEILRRTFNFNDEEFKANKNSLKQIVISVKTGALVPTFN